MAFSRMQPGQTAKIIRPGYKPLASQYLQSYDPNLNRTARLVILWVTAVGKAFDGLEPRLPRGIPRVRARRAAGMVRANFGRAIALVISLSTAVESAPTSSSSACSRVCARTLSTFSAALTTAEASKAINRQPGLRGARRCRPQARHRRPDRSGSRYRRRVSLRRWRWRADSGRIVDGTRDGAGDQSIPGCARVSESRCNLGFPCNCYLTGGLR